MSDTLTQFRVLVSSWRSIFVWSLPSFLLVIPSSSSMALTRLFRSLIRVLPSSVRVSYRALNIGSPLILLAKAAMYWFTPAAILSRAVSMRTTACLRAPSVASVVLVIHIPAASDLYSRRAAAIVERCVFMLSNCPLMSCCRACTMTPAIPCICCQWFGGPVITH